jgi:flagellar hook-associated protein 3 FlgL
MRLSSIQIYNQALGGIRNATSEVVNTQEQIATNQQVNTPSDDPTASALIINLETELERSRQFQRNIDRIETFLQRGETQINSIEDAIDRVRELVIQSNGVAMTPSSREAIALEIEQKVQELLGYINSRDENGDYIFSGYNSTEPTFLESDGKYVFQGDAGERFEQISNGIILNTNIVGKYLFDEINMTNVLPDLVPSKENSSLAQIVELKVKDIELFNQEMFPAGSDGYIIEFNPIDDVFPPSPNFKYINASNGSVSGNIVYDQSFGINSDSFSALTTETPLPGDRFFLKPKSKDNVLNIISSIGKTIKEYEEINDQGESQNELFDNFVSSALEDLSSIQSNLRLGQSDIGSRLNTLDNTKLNQQSLDLISQGLLSDTRDLDYTEAVSRLSFQTFVLEAAQQSFVKVANLSLFNFLRSIS